MGMGTSWAPSRARCSRPFAGILSICLAIVIAAAPGYADGPDITTLRPGTCFVGKVPRHAGRIQVSKRVACTAEHNAEVVAKFNVGKLPGPEAPAAGAIGCWARAAEYAGSFITESDVPTLVHVFVARHPKQGLNDGYRAICLAFGSLTRPENRSVKAYSEAHKVTQPTDFPIVADAVCNAVVHAPPLPYRGLGVADPNLAARELGMLAANLEGERLVEGAVLTVLRSLPAPGVDPPSLAAWLAARQTFVAKFDPVIAAARAGDLAGMRAAANELAQADADASSLADALGLPDCESATPILVPAETPSS